MQPPLKRLSTGTGQLEGQRMQDVDENFGRLETEIDLLKGEVIPVTLTNSSPYPFNNSVQTISLTKEKPSTDYYVDVELISATGGSVGNFRVTDKLLNSFKLAFDGGATSVSVICRVKGGI